MPIGSQVRRAFEAEEARTVGDAFGGTGSRETFKTSVGIEALLQAIRKHPGDPLAEAVSQLQEILPRAWTRLVAATMRFAFLIELTNLSVTSTKFKTRWIPVPLTANENSRYVARLRFEAPEDPRASSFEECYDIFCNAIATLVADENLRMVALDSVNRGAQFVFTYADPAATRVHVPANVVTAPLEDLVWILEAAPLIYAACADSVRQKLATKAYLTDRAQTGLTQTNRAKRWEVASTDYQHAPIEDCWSVERKLLASIADFDNFPSATREVLVTRGLVPPERAAPLCPVTLLPMCFDQFQTASGHGRSDFQVGHLVPLKAGGKHTGSNVGWISRDGNRIQGDRSIEETHALLQGIVERLLSMG